MLFAFVPVTPMPCAKLLAIACLLALGFPLQSAASGPPVPPDSTSLAVDSSRVAVRHPPDTLLARFRNDPAYNYERAEGWTWWRDLRRWVRAQLAQLFGSGTTGGRVLQLASYLFLALLVGYAAYMLVQLRSTARAPGRTAPDTVARPRTAEEMQAIDFDTRLEAAVANGQYRRAVRLLYQQALQRLDRADAIAWRPGKTNRAYVNELGADLRPAFSTLTRLFERVWYGGAAVDAERFAEVRARFDSFWETVPPPERSGSDEDASATGSVRRNLRTADRPSA